MILVGCHSSSQPAKSAGPLWSPAMFTPLHSLTPDCELKANVWECHGDNATATVTLDGAKHLVSVRLTDFTRMAVRRQPGGQDRGEAVTLMRAS